jgi:phage terminase Nu1 subunit (DNA packaging protein)
MNGQLTGALRERGILNRDQLVAELGIKKETVREWEKRGMPNIKEGMTILYDIGEVIDWMRKRTKKAKTS